MTNQVKDLCVNPHACIELIGQRRQAVTWRQSCALALVELGHWERVPGVPGVGVATRESEPLPRTLFVGKRRK